MQHVLGILSIPFPFIGGSRRHGTTALAPRTAQNVLNYDLWYKIATYLSVEDARTLSTVSRECHAAAVRHSLSFVKPTDKAQLQKLCSSLSNAVYYPASLLHELQIGREALGALSYSTVWVPHHFDTASPIPGGLADLLGRTVNLQVLSLHCAEGLIEANPSVGDALARLEWLDCLELMDIGEKTFAVTMRMASRPTQFTLSYETRKSSASDLLTLTQLPLLGRVRTLGLHGFVFNNAPVNANLTGADLIRPWPACAGPAPLVLRVAPLLPALSQPAQPLDVAGLRDAQDGHGLRVVAVDSAPGARRRGPAQHRDATLHTIRETTPVVLSMLCTEFEMHRSEFWEGLVAAATLPRARLRYLMLTLKCVQADALRWLKDMAPLLAATRLLSIRLIVVDVGSLSQVQEQQHYDAETGVAPAVWHGDPLRVPSYWQDFFRMAQSSLAGAIPSLRLLSMLYVARPNLPLQIRYCDDYDGEFSWWRVAEGEGDEYRTVDAMPLDIGEAVHRHLLSGEFEERLDFDGDFVRDIAFKLG
ncbi:hypothetical protein EVJ58_g10433 [Rhodofomes roseus]|uniref:F-box domain-containing protein n=1 Tax=Rhodofomes roseus TaxID=34475 RepID=A0A4Y9XMZ9_9APHY|nr:hypothetical protein EVJ58_g10433 [Rhodofomes roseus]